MKIGLIAGGGALPENVANTALSRGDEVYVAHINGCSDGFNSPKSDWFGIGEFGGITKAFKKHSCTHVCFAGIVERPSFKTMKVDMKGLKHLPSIIKAARNGDDALLKRVVQIFEQDGFTIIAPQDICENQLLGPGSLGDIDMTSEHREDALKAAATALEVGRLDIGQGAVVSRGLILAVEAQEGTDNMLRRVAELPERLRGTSSDRAGVLAKMVKPGQEDRVDLPTIGLQTVELAAKAGMAGIVAEEGRAFIMDREAVIAKANAEGLFIVGLPKRS